MSIRPVDFNGMIQRTDDVSQLKVHQDQKPAIDQQSIQTQVAEQREALTHQVVDAEESSQMQNQADAREEGKGKYFQNRKRKKEKSAEGKVMKKSVGGGFDIKI